MVKLDNKLVRIPDDMGGGYLPQPKAEPVQTVYKTTTVNSSAITRTVRVVDDYGTPIPGAHVYFDQKTGTTTNFNGEASISADSGNKKVYISYVGFAPQGFTLQNLPSTVKMTAGETLDEVIIDAPKKTAAKSDSKVPKYLFPAIGATALLLILMNAGSPTKPKEVTL